MQMVTKAAQSMNGITIAYVMGFTNAALACLGSFGINLSDTQQGSIAALVNAGLILAVHIGHRVGEVSMTTHAPSQQAPEAPPVASG